MTDRKIDKLITKITYNWHQYGNTEVKIDEHYYEIEVGKDGVIEITEFEPDNVLLRHCCVVNYDDGRTLKLFNINTIEYNNDK